MKKSLFIGVLLLSAAALASDVLPINQFSGLNSDENTVMLQEGQTPDSQNTVTDRGLGVEGRKGFIQFSTQPAVDIWQFPKSDGTRYVIKRSSNNLLADTGLGTFGISVSTIPIDRKTVASVLGDKFFFMNTTDGLKYWDGTTVFTASATLKGSMLVTHKGRLWEAGKAGEERSIRASKLYDGTSWTAPVNPSDDDAAILTVGGALDENINAIFASFQDKLIYFKKSSFGGVYGSRRSNFSLRSFSETVGTAAPETIQDCDGFLRWLGNNRKVWEFDGATYYKISDQVNNLFLQISQGDSTTRSTTLTSQSDWLDGTFGNTVISSANTSALIVSGSVVLSTMAALSQEDTNASDFGASASLVNVDTTTSPGNLTLRSNNHIENQQYGADDADGGDASTCESSVSQSFTVGSSSFILTNITIRLRRAFAGINPGDARFYIYDDSSNSPGSSLGYNISDLSGSTISSASYADYTVSFSSIVLIANTRYWIRKTGATVPFGSPTQVLWALTNGSFSESSRSGASCTNSTTQNTKYKVYGSTYPSSGFNVSRTFDVGFTTNTWLFNWSTFTKVVSNPAGTSDSCETQSSPDGVTFGSLQSSGNGALIPSPVQRYLRYKCTMNTTSGVTTPSIGSVILQTGAFLKSSGTYQSKIVPTATNISAWGPITIGNTVSSGGTETFQIGSTNTASLSAITNWTSITNNSVPTISTNPYVAFRSSFTATASTDVVSLNNFTFVWTEGSSLRPASGYIDQRYWLAVATTSTTNNIIYVYDRKKQWQRYIGINADCIAPYGSSWYFGNTTGIYQTEQGYSDAGSNITGYFKTKDYAPTSPDIPSFFNYTYLTTDQSDGTLSASFAVDGATTAVSMGSYQMNQPGLLQNFRIPFSNSDILQGNFINFKWQVDGTNFWRLIHGSLYYDKGLVPKGE